jgi:hypothetical protein
MLILRSFNRFLFTSLALLGLAVSLMNTAQASSYKLMFTTDSQTFPQSSGYFSNPAGAPFVEPGTHLMDIFFDTFPGGPQIDEPNLFMAPINTYDPLAGKITGIDLYNYGTSPETYNPYSAAPPIQYVGEVLDDGRDGSVDGFDLRMEQVMAPFPYLPPIPGTDLPPPGAPLLDLFVRAIFQPFPGADILELQRAFAGESLVGDWTISEISAVPVPAAVWLFGTALIGLVGFSKRKARIAA